FLRFLSRSKFFLFSFRVFHQHSTLAGFESEYRHLVLLNLQLRKFHSREYIQHLLEPP
ncbi:glycosyltransferase, partial [Listeria innocua FSL J1-023]